MVDDALAAFDCGKDSFAQGDYAEAERQFAQAQSLDSSNPDYPAWLARALLGTERRDQALSALSSSFELGECAIAYMVKGNLRDPDDLDGRISDFTWAITLDPVLVPALVDRGDALRGKGLLDEAIATYSCPDRMKLAKCRPYYEELLHPATADLIRIYYGRGRAFSAKGLYKQAIADFAKAVELSPEHSEARSALNEALALQEASDLNEAECPKAGNAAADSYNDGGLAYAKSRSLDQAIALFDKAIVSDSSHAGAYNNRGLALSLKGYLDRAICDFTQAIELDPNDSAPYFNRGDALSDKGLLDAAIDDYTKAIVLKPEDAGYYYNRGIALGRKGLGSGAIANYTMATELNPRHVGAYNNLGNEWRKKGEFKEALHHFSQAIFWDGKYVRGYMNRGDTAKDVGWLENAIVDYTRVIELDPENARAYRNRGEVLHAMGLLGDAAADLVIAQRLGEC